MDRDRLITAMLNREALRRAQTGDTSAFVAPPEVMALQEPQQQAQPLRMMAPSQSRQRQPVVTTRSWLVDPTPSEADYAPPPLEMTEPEMDGTRLPPDIAFHPSAPTRGSAPITSRFGPRRQPRPGASTDHRGIDMGVSQGTPVYASADGEVQIVEGGPGGRSVRLQHPGVHKYRTHYAHLSRYAPGLESGARVRRGDLIGYSGNTGVSTGAHLHYGMFRDDEAVDPLQYLPIEV